MKLASARFHPGVQHPLGVKTSREVVASDDVHLELSDATKEIAIHVVGTSPWIYSPSAWESYEPAKGQICTVCLARLEQEKPQGETCSRSCAAVLRHRRSK